jgi:hypothetical protein
MQPTALRRTKRARVSRAVLLPLFVAAALLASAVAAQGLPVQATAGRQLSAPTGPRPSLVRQRQAGDPFAADRRLSGHVSGSATATADTTATAGPFGSFGSALVGSVQVPPGPNGVAVDRATNTANAPQTITLGPVFTSPSGVAIDQATDTIYVADLENGEGPGAASVINGAACNAATSAGCGQTPPTVTVGFGPSGIAFNPANRTVVVTNIEDTSVSVIDAATCNAVVTSSCGSTQPELAAGRGPGPVAVDPAAGTIYVSNGDGTVSIIPAIR